MSDINGKGYGDTHDWENIGSHGLNSIHMECLTEYQCKKCNAYFRHFYKRPGKENIFEAMQLWNDSNGIGECKS